MHGGVTRVPAGAGGPEASAGAKLVCRGGAEDDAHCQRWREEMTGSPWQQGLEAVGQQRASGPDKGKEEESKGASD